MYLRTIKRRNQDGSVVAYLQLAHNVRRPNGAACAEVIHKVGPADRVDPATVRRLARSLQRLDRDPAAATDPDPHRVERSRELGGAVALAAVAPTRDRGAAPGAAPRPGLRHRHRAGAVRPGRRRLPGSASKWCAP